MHLVERDQLVDRLLSSVAAARAGRGSIVVVSGEAGAGKTSLVRQVLSTSPAVWGYCEPLSTPRPLGPFRDISDRLWGDRTDQVSTTETAYVDPGVIELGERLLARLRSDPVPLVIEDAHWIDAASADVLRFLGRRIETTNSLLVITCRDEPGASHALRRIVGELATSPALTRLEVPALSKSAVAQLVAHTELEPAEAFALTGGNAFLVGQLIDAVAAGVGPERVTASVRDATAARVMQLSLRTRDLVELLSVIPGRVRSALLGGSWPALDEAVAAGLVRVDGTGVAFRHELVRLAVLEGLPPGRQRRLHAETLRRMLDLGDVEPALLAFHARAADDLTEASAQDRAAAEHAVSLGAHREAVAHYRRALGDGALVERRDERAGLWLALSAEERILGHDDQALKAAQQAVLLCPPGSDPLRRGNAVRWLAQVTPSESLCHQLARSAVDILEPLGRTRELAAAYALVGSNRMVARDLAVAKVWAHRTITLATELGDRAGLVSALQTLGCALTLDGEESDGRHLRQAVDLARAAGLDAELGRAYSNFVSATGEAKLYRLSSEVTEEALAYFVGRDLDGQAQYTRAWSARCLFEQGRWSEAETVTDGVLGSADGGGLIAMVTAWCTRSRIRIRRGTGAFRESLDRAQSAADTTDALQRMAPVAAARAEACWLAGEKDDGSAGLVRCYEMALERSHGWLVGELGLWMWRHRLLDVLPGVAAAPYRLQTTDPAAAGAAWRAIGCPYETADAWCDSTEEETVRQALDIFTRLGAAPGRLRAARRLRELGVRSIPRGPRHAAAVHPNGLTAREQEVLLLLAGGLTDPEIAHKLQLSAKTVGHHVSAVLRKTGSRSRRELRGPDH